jgi:hypothetical protein
VRLNRDQSREAVLCDQLIPTTEIAYEVPADTVRPCHQQIDEVVDHDRHLGTVDRLKPYPSLSGTNHLFHAREIQVRHGWDLQEGQIDLETRSGRRRVPIVLALRDHPIDHRLDRARLRPRLRPLGRPALRPASSDAAADRTWKAAGLDRITLHGCRPTFASLMIAAGVIAKALSTFMGHA